MPPHDAILFDCDGTLVETHHDIAASARHARAVLGLDPIDDALIPSYMGLGIDHLIRMVIGPENAGRFDAARDAYVAHHAEHCADHARLYDGADVLLDRLHSRGIRIGLLSNKNERFCRIILADLGIADRFTLIFGADTTSWKKPDPGGLLELAARMPSTTPLYVGDSDVDIRTARAAGMPVGFLDHGYGSVGPEEPDHRWRDFAAMTAWIDRCPIE